MYLWDLSGIQERVGNAGEQSTNIHRDDNGILLADVRLSSFPLRLHGGGGRGLEGKAPGRKVDGTREENILDDRLLFWREEGSSSTSSCDKGIPLIQLSTVRYIKLTDTKVRRLPSL